ncbi:hypothetical protein Sjap_019485 [Stephania japonica]|uniref:Uncharacterized protein n=1 Tax=Stephania japonica TaxID=461633 RepID=A0AAP0EYW5_9MAGN
MELEFGRTRLFLGFKFGAALACSHFRNVQSLRPSSALIRFLNFAVVLYVICSDSQPCHDFSISRWGSSSKQDGCVSNEMLILQKERIIERNIGIEVIDQVMGNPNAKQLDENSINLGGNNEGNELLINECCNDKDEEEEEEEKEFGLFDEQGLLYFDDLLRLVLRSNRLCELGEFWSARFQSA